MTNISLEASIAIYGTTIRMSTGETHVVLTIDNTTLVVRVSPGKELEFTETLRGIVKYWPPVPPQEGTTPGVDPFVNIDLDPTLF